MTEGWVTKATVAEHLGVSVSTVDHLVARGMPSAKLGDGRQGARRFLLSEVDDWMREHGKDGDGS